MEDHLLRGFHDAGEDSYSPPIKKWKVTINLDTLARDWRFPVEEVQQILAKHIASKKQENDECYSSKLTLKYAFIDGGINVQLSSLQLFNNLVAKRKRILEVNDHIDHRKFENVLA